MLCLSRNPVMIVPYKTDEICYKNGDRFGIVLLGLCGAVTPNVYRMEVGVVGRGCLRNGTHWHQSEREEWIFIIK